MRLRDEVRRNAKWRDGKERSDDAGWRRSDGRRRRLAPYFSICRLHLSLCIPFVRCHPSSLIPHPSRLSLESQASSLKPHVSSLTTQLSTPLTHRTAGQAGSHQAVRRRHRRRGPARRRASPASERRSRPRRRERISSLCFSRSRISRSSRSQASMSREQPSRASGEGQRRSAGSCAKGIDRPLHPLQLRQRPLLRRQQVQQPGEVAGVDQFQLPPAQVVQLRQAARLRGSIGRGCRFPKRPLRFPFSA